MTAKRSGKDKASARSWSHDVTEHSKALDLETGVFTLKDPKEIAASLKCSAEASRRRKADPFRSAMSMLVFYINRAGKYDNRSDWQLTQMQLGRLAMAFAAEALEDVELAWGKKVNAPFKRKVIEISAELGIDPNFLMAAMAFESARTFSASIQNPYSGAVGLIQFMPGTAKGLGTSTAALKKMTPLAQLDYVRRYFLPSKGELRDLSDVYMAILWPRAVGRLSSYVLFAQGSNEYKQNKGLDVNNDGVVTKVEAANLVQQHLVEGMREELRG